MDRPIHVEVNTAEYKRIYDSEATILSPIYTSDLVEISIVVEGGGIHKVFDEATECQKGDMHVFAEPVPHGYFAKGDGEAPTVSTLLFNPAELFDDEWSDPKSPRFCSGVFTYPLPVSYALLNSEALEDFIGYFKLIFDESSAKRQEWQKAVRAYISVLLISAGRYIDMANTEKREHPKEWLTVSSAIKLINERCGSEDMTLENIASSLYISKSSLSKIFQSVTGETFSDYVKKTRIALACKLLKTTNLTNAEIVNRCGLKDVPSFYAAFKAYMAMTPYQYRMTKTEHGDDEMSIYLEISEQLQKGKAKAVKELVQQAVDEGMPATRILNEGLLSAMNEVGEKFKNNELYVPEVLVAARAMNAGLQILKPLLMEDGVQSAGRVCIGTVQGDMHDIGKNLVKMMMEGKGLEVIDLGTDVSPESFVKTAIEQDCRVICCSALLTTTMDVMADVVRCAEEAGVRDRIKIMIGGAPVNEEFCKKIGADKYTPDAASAADAAAELCKSE